MRSTVLSRFVQLLLLSAIAALLWMSYGFARSYRLFDSAAFSSVFYVAALVSTAILFVFVTETLVVHVFLAWRLQNGLTQLQRGLIAAALTFIAAAIALWYSGFNLTTILTTSAFVSAIVALSVQPMLASLMSGLSLHQLIRIGDAVLLDGEPVEIISLNWRSVMTRRSNGSTVFVPNARLADGTLQVLAHDSPTRAEVRLDVPTSVAPHRVRKLIAELLEDFAEVDSTQPVVVLPEAYEAAKPLMGYRVEFCVRHYAQRAAVEGRVLRRLWYVFQREGITSPVGDLTNPQSGIDSALHMSAVIAALGKAPSDRPDLTVASESLAKVVLAAGEGLLYDEGERIILPERLASRVYILLEGELSEMPLAGQNANGPLPWKTSAHAWHELTRAASLSLIERALVRRIGPYAAWAVEQAAAGGASLTEICATVAQEIDDPAEREMFLQETCPPTERISGPGLAFRSSQDTAQRFVADPPMRAVEYALILAVPESALKLDASVGNQSSTSNAKERDKPNHSAPG